MPIPPKTIGCCPGTPKLDRTKSCSGKGNPIFMLIGMNLIGTVAVVVVLCPAQFWTLVWVPLMELLEGLKLQVSDPMSKLRLKISGCPRKSLSAALFAR